VAAEGLESLDTVVAYSYSKCDSIGLQRTCSRSKAEVTVMRIEDEKRREKKRAKGNRK
jgi:hypothetical protein